jgi:multidrug transporter EmrE-like cation transporter
VIGLLLFSEPATMARCFLIGLIIIGIIELEFA